ncbi:hypothetical protein ACC713_38490, partial [Rhizobium johnstonii]|uniref:hypothetical protein n=1 Tax=Rhizobium johnstonii TaxID=3019933 RepID=UPI003F989671
RFRQPLHLRFELLDVWAVAGAADKFDEAGQRFLIGIRLLTGAINGVMAARALTHLADLIIAAALDAVVGEMRAAQG